MRLFTLDISGTIESVKLFLSEFKNPIDLLDFFIELNELKDILLELYMSEKHEISLEEFLNLLEEQIQFDLNRLSTKVQTLEEVLLEKKDKKEK